MTVDVKGNSPLWLKVKDLAEGVTYRFRIKAKTFTYGPEVEANITTGPGEGRRDGMSHCPSLHILRVQVRRPRRSRASSEDSRKLIYSSISCPKAPLSLSLLLHASFSSFLTPPPSTVPPPVSSSWAWLLTSKSLGYSSQSLD